MINTLMGSFSQEEFLLSGHNACPGCGPAIAVRHIMKVTASRAVIVIPASCWSIISGVVPLRALETVVMHCPFPSAAATGGGIKKGLEAVGDPHTQVLVLAGDGGTFDIGLQGLSGAAERNEDIIFVCYDNEAYMNTGMQKSSASPYGSYSTTTPAPKVKGNPKKDIMKIMAAHQVPYAATATIAFPGDLSSKVERALERKGFRFLHILTPCPQGWGSPIDKTVELSRLAVLTRLFPLWEVEGGVNYRINFLPEEYLPVNEYLKSQKRFSSLEQSQVDFIQENVERQWEELCHKAGVANRFSAALAGHKNGRK
jgi:pyruvate ferredoxin oxidoreductase beta subunit/2-oxoisovalerate ferredoxin oxidoreductase beta subunit